VIQLFYECRAGMLDRYMSFCVLFHAMAKDCSSPWLRRPWDMAHSQSNLRVSTTASPVPANEIVGAKTFPADILRK
ncbi:unnamed protein product, partial [Discosporangium mesarthrocarpum]